MLPMQNLDSFQKQLDELKRSYPAYGVQPVSQPAPSAIKYVDGIAKAKEYQSNMASGSSEIIMDKNEDIFYVVSKDANGTSPQLITIGRFTLEQEEPPESKFVTKDDLAAFEQRIINLFQNQEVKHE